MPGIQKVEVNAQANPTLAAIAVDPTVKQDRADALRHRSKLKTIAKGA